ncbi:hypothetical protein M758_12G105800 [Ceratodon purpureus]|nr:hypothetical protein M758_12G105800 [Ceratodon purpureus]
MLLPAQTIPTLRSETKKLQNSRTIAPKRSDGETIITVQQSSKKSPQLNSTPLQEPLQQHFPNNATIRKTLQHHRTSKTLRKNFANTSPAPAFVQKTKSAT